MKNKIWYFVLFIFAVLVIGTVVLDKIEDRKPHLETYQLGIEDFTENNFDSQQQYKGSSKENLEAKEQEPVKCDLSAINFTCVWEVNQTKYWEYIMPSKQCEGVKVSQMKDYLITQKTGSMRPYINYGDTILVVDYNPNRDLVLGDVVSTGSYLHRIVSINTRDETYRTQGDNNQEMDRVSKSFDNTEYVVCGVIRATE